MTSSRTTPQLSRSPSHGALTHGKKSEIRENLVKTPTSHYTIELTMIRLVQDLRQLQVNHIDRHVLAQDHFKRAKTVSFANPGN